MYPCELIDLYLSDLSGVPNDKSFDYFIKSRYIDIEYGNIALNTTKIVNTIQSVWFTKNKNRGIDATQIEVKLADLGFYTSIFKK